MLLFWCFLRLFWFLIFSWLFILDLLFFISRFLLLYWLLFVSWFFIICWLFICCIFLILLLLASFFSIFHSHFFSLLFFNCDHFRNIFNLITLIWLINGSKSSSYNVKSACSFLLWMGYRGLWFCLWVLHRFLDSSLSAKLYRMNLLYAECTKEG